MGPGLPVVRVHSSGVDNGYIRSSTRTADQNLMGPYSWD